MTWNSDLKPIMSIYGNRESEVFPREQESDYRSQMDVEVTRGRVDNRT